MLPLNFPVVSANQRESAFLRMSLFPNDRVYMCGEWEHSEHLTKTYANHHRHTCIGARAGFGDLLIGASAMMIETNGLDVEAEPHLHEAMVELIKTVESFYACGVSASVYGKTTDVGNYEPGRSVTRILANCYWHTPFMICTGLSIQSRAG